jgi:hypothetical protein
MTKEEAEEMRKTKKAYEEYLNSLSPEQGSEEWIIGGKIRMYHMWKNQWGTAMRKFDPIRFQVGYNEWKST